MKDFLVPALVADEQKAQSIVFHDFEGRARYVGFRVAGPLDPEFTDRACKRFNSWKVVGQGVIIKEVFLDLWKRFFRPNKLFHHMADAPRAVPVPSDRLR